MATTRNGATTALSVAEKRAAVVAAVREGKPFRAIAAELGISKSYAHDLFQAALELVPAENVQAYREQQLADLALARQVAREILGRHHVTISNGRVMHEITGRNEETDKPIYGDPYEDAGPELAALNTLMKIGEREAQILGSDAEKKVNLSGGVTYEVVGVDLGKLT
jgi:transposase-like protein